MADIHVITNREYDAHPRHRFDAFFPDPLPERTPLVCCLHGGWWHGGHREDLRPLALALADQGLPTAVIGFRRLRDIPGTDGTEMLGDCLAGIRKALEEALLHDHDGRHLALLGIESGATLALLTAVNLHRAADVNLHSVVGISGCYDLVATDACDTVVRQQAAAFIGADAAHRNPATLHRGFFPPVRLFHGEQDMTVPATAATAFCDHLTQATIPAVCTVQPQGGHEILEVPWRGTGESILRAIVDWLGQNRHVDSDGPTVGEAIFMRESPER